MFMFGNERFELKFKLGSIRGDLSANTQTCRPVTLKHTQGDTFARQGS